MANPSDKQMLRDANGDLIPQYWDVVAGDFKPLTGSDGAQDTKLTGSIAGERLGYEVIPDGGFIEAYTDLKHSYFRILVAPDEATRIQLFHTWLDVNGFSLGSLRSATTTDVNAAYISEKTESQTTGYRVRLYNRGDVPVRMKLEFIHLER